MKLIMTKGLPASGKTTWARTQKGFKRVNKDDLRGMVDNGKFSNTNEAFILQSRDAIIYKALREGHNIIVDDTNLASKHEARLRAIAEELGAEFQVKDFTHVPVEECIKRNAARPNSVPEKVIYMMYEGYIKKEVEPREYVEGLQEAIIVDIDGTIARHPHRGHFEYSKVSEDIPVPTIINLVKDYQKQGVKAIFCSGRDGCYVDTWNWLQDQGFGNFGLFMRVNGDQRPDYIIKKELYETYIKPNFNIRLVLDDRNSVVKMWREQGLTCLQVAEGNF